MLDAQGRPCVTERVFVLPPGSQIGPITPEQRTALLQGSLVAGTYEKTIDRVSAYEKLKGRAGVTPPGDPSAAAPASAPPATGRMPIGTGGGDAAPGAGGGLIDGLKDAIFGSTGPRGGHYAGLAEKAATSAVRSIGSAVGRELIRGVLGSLLGGKR